MQQISLGGFIEWETSVYFWPLFEHFKTLLTTLTNSALVGGSGKGISAWCSLASRYLQNMIRRRQGYFKNFKTEKDIGYELWLTDRETIHYVTDKL